MDIYLEHVRSFSKRKFIPLRPLTLLVGENSSGKSTFLSVVSAVLNRARFPLNPGLNEPPYNLGTYDTIATYRGGKYGRDDTFSLGFATGEKESPDRKEVIATYGSDYGNVSLRRLRITSAMGHLDASVADSKIVVKFAPAGDGSQERQFTLELPEPTSIERQDFTLQLFRAMYEPERKLTRPSAEQILSLIESMSPPYSDCFSFAPIRSKPRRTYDETGVAYSPEGEHVPRLLARLLRQEPTSQDAQRVQQAIVSFGRESGLFKTIRVKKLGHKVTDPFQLQVTAAGPPVNVVDVGYGVSQSLPIVVQSVLSATSKVILMQQPEVHLHPRAQAALGTFLAELATTRDQMMLVETHSDYLVDRVRQEVSKGTIPAESVSILFFHKPQLETSVWNLTLDREGNVQGAPSHYREFFMQEELNLFTRTS